MDYHSSIPHNTLPHSGFAGVTGSDLSTVSVSNLCRDQMRFIWYGNLSHGNPSMTRALLEGLDTSDWSQQKTSVNPSVNLRLFCNTYRTVTKMRKYILYTSVYCIQKKKLMVFVVISMECMGWIFHDMSKYLESINHQQHLCHSLPFLHVFSRTSAGKIKCW